MKNTVHIVLENGVIWEAYGEGDVEIVVYDLDTDDPETKAKVERELLLIRAKAENHEIKIL